MKLASEANLLYKETKVTTMPTNQFVKFGKMFSLDQSRIPYYRYLFRLRDSGICNMMEGEGRMRSNFPGLSRQESESIFFDWIGNCAKIEEGMGWEKEVESDGEERDDDTTDMKEDDCPQPAENSYWNGRGKYQAENDRLHDKYVPAFGVADSPQGNLLRVVSKLYYRYFNDGDTNLSEFEWLLKESPIPLDVPEEFYEHFGCYDSESLERMVDIAVEYSLEKEKEDIKLRPETNAKHEERLAEKRKWDAEMKAQMERRDTILSPIRKQLCSLDLKGARSSLTKKNMKANGITESDVQWIMHGVLDHIHDVLYGNEEKKKSKNGVTFGKLAAFLVGKRLLHKNTFSGFDMEQMYKVYPRAKSVIAGTVI